MNLHNSTSRKVRASDLPSIIRSNSPMKKTVQKLVQTYVYALMISGYPKSLKNIAVLFGLGISSLSRMLSNPLLSKELDVTLNRKVRQIIASYFNGHQSVTAEIIIDATLIERSSRKAENVGLYHSNGKKTWGHRITNVGILLDGNTYIPLAAISHYTRRHAKSQGLAYLTEGMMVNLWLRNHMGSLIDLLGKGAIQPEDITFLLDAGYDNSKIQKDILETGCHFLMMIKNTRSVGGFQVKKFFARNRCLAWQSVYFNKDVNGKSKRRKYRIRTAEKVHLSKVGLVTAVCSEKAGGRRNKKKTRRYLITSRPELSGREIIQCYARRWTIETWHKKIKQSYGFNDCSTTKFQSVENHIALCMISYLSHLQNLKNLPSKNTTIQEYLQLSVRKQTRQTLRLIGGRDKLNNEIEEYRSEIFAKAI